MLVVQILKQDIWKSLATIVVAPRTKYRLRVLLRSPLGGYVTSRLLKCPIKKFFVFQLFSLSSRHFGGFMQATGLEVYRVFDWN